MTSMYRLRSKKPLSAAIECLVYRSGRRPMANDITRRVHWEMHSRSEGPVFSIIRPMDYFMLPTERAEFHFNPGPPLKVRFMDATNYWFDEPAWIPSPFTETLDETVIDIPMRVPTVSRLEVIRKVFG